MKRITALLLSAVLLCSCAGGQGAQNSGDPDQGKQDSVVSEQVVQESEESAADTQKSEASDQDTQNSGETDADQQDQGRSDQSASSASKAVVQQVGADEMPQAGTLPQVDFPDWKGYADDTLAMNSMYSFYGCHGQGAIYVSVSGEVESFRMYVNNTPIATEQMEGGGTYKIDLTGCALDGVNTLQVSNISPAGLQKAVSVSITYPEVLEGTLEEAGIAPQTIDLISDLIETDIANGFTSAQLAVVRNGRLVYENAWGRTNSYLPDGSPCTDSAPVTTDTLYDLASVTKMQINRDEIRSENEDPAAEPDLETSKQWKAELTIRDLLRHQGGFPADPKYCAPLWYKEKIPESEFPANPYFAGNGADEATKQATIEMICKTPLDYEPGTKTLYSDLDYMILGLVVEKILDTWLKETFYKPMGLTHITYNPLENGFKPEDCAATELNGNTRDNLLHFEGYRTQTLQGQVHDEKAYYSMAGISGHAGLFSNATDLAKLASVMLSGGYGENRFFARNVMDMFTAPKKEDAANWGLGWWRQGDDQRVWYFGTQAQSGTIGHQGWTGTLCMIDPERDLVVVYLTNKINTPVTDVEKDANKFDGGWYTAGTLGFVPQIMSIGMDSGADVSAQLLDLTADMAVESLKRLPEGVTLADDHPAVRNVKSKRELFEKECEKLGASGSVDAGHIQTLKDEVEAAMAR